MPLPLIETPTKPYRTLFSDFQTLLQWSPPSEQANRNLFWAHWKTFCTPKGPITSKPPLAVFSRSPTLKPTLFPSPGTTSSVLQSSSINIYLFPLRLKSEKTALLEIELVKRLNKLDVWFTNRLLEVIDPCVCKFFFKPWWIGRKHMEEIIIKIKFSDLNTFLFACKKPKTHIS